MVSKKSESTGAGSAEKTVQPPPTLYLLIDNDGVALNSIHYKSKEAFDERKVLSEQGFRYRVVTYEGVAVR